MNHILSVVLICFLYKLHMIDLDRFNPDWQFAMRHGRACKPGKPTSSKKGQQDDSYVLCDCCLNVIEKDEVPLCQNSKELQFLGFGFPLYYIFLKYGIVFLFILIISYSSMSIYWGVQDNYQFCVEHIPKFDNATQTEYECTSWMVQFSRTEEVVTHSQIILRFTSFIIQLAALVYIRDVIRKTNEYYDQRTTSLSDYSAFFLNIPKQKGLGQKMKKFCNEFFKQPHKVEEIIYLNQIDEYYKIKSQKEHLIHQKQKLLNEKQQNKEELDRVNKQMEIKDQLINNQYEKQLELIKKDEVLCEKVILVFSSEGDKEAILQQFEQADRSKLKDFFEGDTSNMTIDQAPEPKQISWRNVNYPRNKKIARFFLGWGLTFVFLAVVTVIFFFILQAKTLALEQALKEYHDHPQESAHLKQGAVGGVFIAILMIIFFNKFILATVLHIFTALQMHPTGGDFEYSFALKYTLGLFFTTALMTLLVQDIRFHNIYHQSYGVTEQQTVMFFMNSFLVPLIWLINPWYILKIAKRWYYFGNRNITQKAANEIMEDVPYSMGKRYAEILESIWFTFLYSSLIPLGAFLIFIGLALFYWIDKYNLLKKSCIKENVSGGMSMKAMRLLDVTLILRSAGEMIFDSQIRDGISYQPIICLCVAFVFCILPKDEILDFFHQEKFRPQQKSYEQVKHRFIENYTTLHPLFSKQRNAIITSMVLLGRTLKFTTNMSNESGGRGVLNQTLEQLHLTQQPKPSPLENMLMIRPKRKLSPINT